MSDDRPPEARVPAPASRANPDEPAPHEEKIRRQQSHITMLTVGLLGALAMLAYSAAFDLDAWAEWVVLGGIVFTALGFMIAAQSQARS